MVKTLDSYTFTDRGDGVYLADAPFTVSQLWPVGEEFEDVTILGKDTDDGNMEVVAAVFDKSADLNLYAYLDKLNSKAVGVRYGLWLGESGKSIIGGLCVSTEDT